jgi:hypothetical protein
MRAFTEKRNVDRQTTCAKGTGPEVGRMADQDSVSSAGQPAKDPRFNFDFSRVSVHGPTLSASTLPDETRAALSGSLGVGAGTVGIETSSTETGGAEGMTVGRRVHLGPGRFDTQNYEGRVRLGHEVTHAIQQEQGSGLSSWLAPGQRAALEVEAEQAGHAFASGRRFSVMGKAPPTVALFRGLGDEQEPEADRELDAAIQKVLDRQAAQGAVIEKYRQQRKEEILANLEWREYDVPVDERLRKTPAEQQPHELWIRVLQIEFPSVNRDDAEEILRRTGIKAWSAESNSIAEQIRTRDKIQFRTKYMRLLAEIYNEIIEDRARALRNVDELLNPGPDMAAEMFKDVGRGYYNGALGFGQGLVDLPLAPVNLIQSIRGGEQKHLLNLSGLRAGYHTSYGYHYGSSIELGTQLGLMLVSGKLPLGASAGTGAAVNTASQVSRAARLFSIWSKVNAVSAGATSIVQAGQAIRDLARGYVIEDGKKRPLTDDDILGRLAGIAFGLHAAKSALGGTAGKVGSEPTPPVAGPEMTIERPTPANIQISVPGEPGKLVIDDAGWRVLAADGQVVVQGPPEEGALLASQLGETQSARPAPGPPVTTPAPPVANEPAGQTTPTPPATLSVLPGGGQTSGKPTGLLFDADRKSPSVRVDTSHPIFKDRVPANEQEVPPAPQAKAMQAGAPAAGEVLDMPKVEGTPDPSPSGDTVGSVHMGAKMPPSSPTTGSVSSNVQTSPAGREVESSPPVASTKETQPSSPEVGAGRSNSPEVYDLQGNPLPQKEFGKPGVPGGPDRVIVVPNQKGAPETVYVVRGGKEVSFAATNRTLEEQQGRGYMALEPGGNLLSVEELQGKRVLDLAAGTEGLTVRELRNLNAKIDAYGMDIALSESARQTGYLQRADVATAVPFEGQFDVAFELYGGFAYGLGEGTGPAFQNAISKVKPGGTLYLAPLSENSQAALQPFVDKLVAHGGSVRKTSFHGVDQIWRITVPAQAVATAASQ